MSYPMFQPNFSFTMSAQPPLPFSFGTSSNVSTDVSTNVLTDGTNTLALISSLSSASESAFSYATNPPVSVLSGTTSTLEQIFSYETNPFEQVVINTADGKQMSFPINLLVENSTYFKTLFTERRYTLALLGPNMKPLKTVSFPHKYQTLSLILQCILADVNPLKPSEPISPEPKLKSKSTKPRLPIVAIIGREYLKKYCLGRLNNIDDMCDFIEASYKFDLDYIKIEFDLYFSDPALIKQFCCNKMVRMVMINEFKIKNIYINLVVALKESDVLLKSLKFKDFTDSDMRFFFTQNWRFAVSAFALWTESKKLTDDDVIKIISIDFRQMPFSYIDIIVPILNNLDDCPKFQKKVFHDLSQIIKKPNRGPYQKEGEHISKKIKRE